MIHNDLSFEVYPFNMPLLRYIIREIKINKKFARTQTVTWDEQKNIIYNIIKDLSKNIHFSVADKPKPTYNLVENYNDSETSLSILPLTEGGNELFEKKLLNKEEDNITETDITDTNFSSNSFICLFKMGLIKHRDIRLFEEGRIESIWKFIKGKNSGSLYETTFGIVVSDILKKIFIIKQSWQDSLGYKEFMYYMSQKSKTFEINDVNNTFRLSAITTNEEFDPEDVASIYSLEIGVNSDLLREYEKKTGKDDAFLRLIGGSKLFGTGRKVKFEVMFSEEGDEDAKKIFSGLHSSFSEIQGEEIEKMFTNFKAFGEKTNGSAFEINFKRDQIYTFEPSDDEDSFEKILEAFIWISNKINPKNDKRE